MRYFTLIAFLAPAFAFAQESIAQGTMPLDPTDPASVAKVLIDAVMNKQWGIVISLGITALIAMLRKWVPETTKLGQWFRSKLGAIVANFTVSLGGALFTMFLAGMPFTIDLVLKALSVALTAAGGWAVFKNIREAVDEKKAAAAGTQAAAEAPKDIVNQ